MTVLTMCKCFVGARGWPRPKDTPVAVTTDINTYYQGREHPKAKWTGLRTESRGWGGLLGAVDQILWR